MANRLQPLTECPRSPDCLHFATHWYCLSGIRDFLVCTKCFEDKIAHSPFVSAFELIYHTPIPGKKATCLFNSSTVDRIFGHAVQSIYSDPNALASLIAHARHRVWVKDCPGTDGASTDQGIRWFGVQQIPDFMVCEACYLDFICGSVFVPNFIPYPTQQRHDQIWACDIATSNIKRHLIENSTRSDWPAFVNAVSHRLHQPRCDGSEQSLTQRNWYTPRAIPNMLICETCYLDEISRTPYMSEFCELRSAWTHSPPAHLTGQCSFFRVSVQICNNQLLERNYGKWVQLLHRMLELPRCGNTVQHAEWYLLVNPRTHQATSFGFCESCYLGCIESSDHSHMFRRERLAGPGQCEFSSSNPRLGESIQKLTELLLTRNTIPLIDYAAGLQPQSITASQSQCQASQAQQNGFSNWQAISAQLAQQHAMKMSMSNMLFAQNSMHNAAMQGIWSQGSSYNQWHDPKYTSAQWDFSQAQNQMFNAMGSGRSRSLEPESSNAK